MTEHKGTVSHGTMRYVDLIPTFADYLEEAQPEHAWIEEFRSPREGRQSDAAVLEACQEVGGDHHAAEIIGWEDLGHLLTEVMEYLNDIAPEGYYFGAHEGDGSDYGFWEIPELHIDCTPKWCEEAHEPNSRCPKWAD